MRIAMVSEHANPLATLGGEDAGGQNVYVAALARTVAAQGHEVRVFTRREAPDTPVEVHANGYVVEHVPAGPPRALPKDSLLPHMPSFTEYLSGRLKDEDFDVVHAHFWMSGLAATAAARPMGIPVVQTFHALGSVKRRHQGLNDTSSRTRIGVEQRLCHEVDHVIATCSDELRELKKLGVSLGNVTVIPCGVDTELFRPAEGPSNRTLLSIGRLVERKGIADVIAALADVPDADLIVAGGPIPSKVADDPEVQRLSGLADEFGVSGRVHFVGAVDQAMVPELMARSAAVVCTPWYEPFGIVPVEAMACGRPVVGSAVGGLMDTIEPGRTGDLVPPRRPDLLAEALRTLLDDPVRRAAYGAAGRRKALESYRWSQVGSRVEQVYAKVADPLSQVVEVGGHG